MPVILSVRWHPVTLSMQLAIPLLEPLRPQKEERELYFQALDELKHLPALPACDPVFDGALFTVSVLDSPDQEPLLQGRWEPPYGIRSYSLLNFLIDGTACMERIRSESSWKPGEISEDDKERLFLEVATSYFEHEVVVFLLAANIARPGVLSVVEGYGFVDEYFVGATKPFFADSLFGAIRASSETGWPKMILPPIAQTWKWLKESGVLVDGVGVEQLGRALSALSHLTSATLSSSSSVDLFWVLLGLEALYARGNVGLKEQLLGKTEVVLGPRTENKKLFGAVYDFRSRLIHGDVDVPLRFSQFDAVEKFERFHEKLHRNEELALAALLGTLHWMVTHNVHSLDFVYALRGTPLGAQDAT